MCAEQSTPVSQAAHPHAPTPSAPGAPPRCAVHRHDGGRECGPRLRLRLHELHGAPGCQRRPPVRRQRRRHAAAHGRQLRLRPHRRCGDERRSVQRRGGVPAHAGGAQPRQPEQGCEPAQLGRLCHRAQHRGPDQALRPEPPPPGTPPRHRSWETTTTHRRLRRRAARRLRDARPPSVRRASAAASTAAGPSSSGR